MATGCHKVCRSKTFSLCPAYLAHFWLSRDGEGIHVQSPPCPQPGECPGCILCMILRLRRSRCCEPRDRTVRARASPLAPSGLAAGNWTWAAPRVLLSECSLDWKAYDPIIGVVKNCAPCEIRDEPPSPRGGSVTGSKAHARGWLDLPSPQITPQLIHSGWDSVRASSPSLKNDRLFPSTGVPALFDERAALQPLVETCAPLCDDSFIFD